MARATKAVQRQTNPTVEEIATMVRRLDRRDQRRLLRLVPELKSVPADDTPETPSAVHYDVKATLAYFYEKMAALPDARPMQDDDPFIEGLTVGEFFALPDEEQERLWDQAHLKAEKELGDREYPVRPDARVAR